MDDSGKAVDKSLEIKSEGGITNKKYTNRDSDIESIFNVKLKDGVTLSSNDVKVKMSPVLDNSVVKSNIDSVKAELSNDKKTITYKLNDTISYDYSLTYMGIKEDIVLESYTGINTFEFVIETNGLRIYEDENDTLYLVDDVSEIKANIGDIIIFTVDERNNAYGKLDYEIIEEKQRYKLIISVDEAYLLDEKTVYPIRIDPTIEINSSSGANAIQDVTINSKDSSDGSSSSLFVGNRPNYGISRVLMKFPGLNLSDISQASQITNATVYIRDLMCESISMPMNAYAFTGNIWSESTASWSNVNPGSYDTSGGSSTINISYDNGATKTPVHTYGFNITSIVKKWKTLDRVQGKGIIFKTVSFLEDGNYDVAKTFASFNRASYKPSLKVTYTALPSRTISDGVYYIRNMHSLRYLDINNSGISNGTSVLQYQFNGQRNQRFRVTYEADGYYSIKPIHINGQTSAIDMRSVSGANTNGTDAQIYTYNRNFDEQKFLIQYAYGGGFQIGTKASNGNKVLEVTDSSTANGAIVQIWDYSNSRMNDNWTFEQEVILNTPLLGQQRDQWCWAASALMAARTHATSTRTQTQLVTHVKGSDINEGGSVEEARDAANFASGTNSYYVTEGILTESEILVEINSRRPVYLSRGWYDSDGNRDNGHATVVYGYRLTDSGAINFLVRDPWPVNEGRNQTWTYDFIINGSDTGRLDSTIRRF